MKVRIGESEGWIEIKLKRRGKGMLGWKLRRIRKRNEWKIKIVRNKFWERCGIGWEGENRKKSLGRFKKFEIRLMKVIGRNMR